MALSASFIPESVGKTRYNSTLLFCLFTSLALCFTTLKVLPSDPEHVGSSRDKIVLGILRIFLFIMIFLSGLYAVFMVRKKDSFHRNHQVFWPRLCPHCDRVVNAMIQQSRELDADTPKELSQHRRKSTTQTSGPSIKMKRVNHTTESWKSRHRRSLQSTKLPSKRSPMVSHDMVRHCEQSIELNELNELNEPNDVSTHGRHRMAGSSEDCDSSRLHEQESSLSGRHIVSSNGKCMNKTIQQARFHCNPHMSLLNTFYVFGIITLINIPLQLVGIFLWLLDNCNSSVNCFGVATQALQDISFMAIIVIGMIFFTTYYGAVFVEIPKFSYPFGTMVVASIYMVIAKFVSPISAILGNPINSPGFLYRLNGTFGYFLFEHEKILTPFYAECGIIAAGVMWQIWSSVYPVSCLNISTTLPPPGSITITHPISSFKKCMRSISLRLFRENVSNCSETHTLIGKVSTAKTFQPLIRQVIMIYLFLCAVYFGLNQFILHSESVKLLEGKKEYIKWCTEIACSLSVLTLYHYQMFVSRSARTFFLKDRASLFNGLIESHDRVLLLSCVGIFTVAFFRLFGAIGILTRGHITSDEIALACFTIIYSIFKIYAVWLMTSFLAIVQRQLLRRPQEVKWTLIALACSVVWNATLWLQESLELASWDELRLFYGDTVGRLIGRLLEPVATLYGLHAAMVAYKAYKDICSKCEMTTVLSEEHRRDHIIDSSL